MSLINYFVIIRLYSRTAIFTWPGFCEFVMSLTYQLFETHQIVGKLHLHRVGHKYDAFHSFDKISFCISGYTESPTKTNVII